MPREKENKIVELNPVPKALRKREHFVFLNDNTTGLCNCRRRSERRITDRLTSYCRAILEEHYALLTKSKEAKADTFVTNTLYPNAMRFANQKTVTITPFAGQLVAAGGAAAVERSLTEAEYKAFLGTESLRVTKANVLDSNRSTHGGSLRTQTSQLTGVYDGDDREFFSMLRQNWQINTFTTTFKVEEVFYVGATRDLDEYTTYDVTIVLKRVHKFFVDVWRFKSMTFTQTGGISSVRAAGTGTDQANWVEIAANTINTKKITTD